MNINILNKLKKNEKFTYYKREKLKILNVQVHSGELNNIKITFGLTL